MGARYDEADGETEPADDASELAPKLRLAETLADALGVLVDVDVMLTEEEAELLDVPLADAVAAELELGEPEALVVATVLAEALRLRAA